MPHGALELDVRAQIVVTAPAPFTRPTRMGRVDGNEGPWLQPEPAGALVGDLRRDLVPQDERFRMDLAARGALPVVMQVAATEAHAPHPERYLPVGGCGARDRLDPHIAGSVQACGAHGVARGRCVIHPCP